MKRNNVSKIFLFGLMFLLVVSLSPATAFTLSEDDDTTTETEDDDTMHMDDDMDDMHDDMHEIDEHRDSEGTVWIETDVMTVTLAPNMPIYQYWYAGDENGSLARFMVGYMR